MKNHETGTAQYITYKDYSNSAIGASVYQSSADPTALASVMRNISVVFSPSEPSAINQFVIEEKKLSEWEHLDDEELAALYAEAAEEDEELVEVGLAHYVDILKQEEDE